MLVQLNVKAEASINKNYLSLKHLISWSFYGTQYTKYVIYMYVTENKYTIWLNVLFIDGFL